MCGICGEVSLRGAPVGESGTGAMLAAMRHRGPDSEGRFVAPGIAAGMTRLAVIDLEGGAQPIDDESGNVTVVFNGEIYNHDELRTRLVASGHRFRSRSDTEVLVHLWEESGPGLVHELDGMFAFCIHDRARGATFLARDRLGIKPLFLARRGDAIVFASELGVILRHPDVGARLEGEALVDLFGLQFVPGRRTVYRDVERLLPGHSLLIERDGVREERYWSIPAAGEESAAELEGAPEELVRRLTTSVESRLVADVPVGVFLSGGLDSSVIALLAARASKERLRSFSVGFDSESHRFDERPFARRVAESLGLEHHELTVTADDVVRLLPELIARWRQPVTDPAVVPTYLMSGHARERVTVVLSGEGADELFAGYRRYALDRRLRPLAGLPGVGAVARIPGLASLLPERADQALAAAAESEGAARHALWCSTVSPGTMSSLFGREGGERFRRRAAEAFRPHFGVGSSSLDSQLRADQAEWLPHDLLEKVDLTTMAQSLEARVPFLDHRIVEWAARLPDRWKLDGSVTKRVVREAFRDDLPGETLARPKRGFDLPLAEWLRGPLRGGVVEKVSREGLAAWPEIDGAEAERLRDEHLAGRRNHGLPLFLLWSVATFLESHERDGA